MQGTHELPSLDAASAATQVSEAKWTFQFVSIVSNSLTFSMFVFDERENGRNLD